MHPLKIEIYVCKCDLLKIAICNELLYGKGYYKCSALDSILGDSCHCIHSYSYKFCALDKAEQ